MRMIANEARVDHPFISYYFSTKAALFETVLKDLIEQHRQALPGWFLGLREMGLADAVSTYLDRALSFHFKHPETYRIILLNMTQSVKKGGRVPHSQIIGDTINMRVEVFSRSTRFNIKPEQIVSFIRCISLLMLNLIGARKYHAEIQGMDPVRRHAPLHRHSVHHGTHARLLRAHAPDAHPGERPGIRDHRCRGDRGDRACDVRNAPWRSLTLHPVCFFSYLNY